MVRQSDHPSSDLDSDESEDFSDLEDVDETGWRAQRMAEMKAACAGSPIAALEDPAPSHPAEQ